MKLFLKLAITFLLLGIILWQLGGIDEVVSLIIGINPWYVVLVLMVNTADRALMTLKWAWLLRGRGITLPFIQGMKIYCASMVWGMFLPATVGADAIRALSTSRLGINSNEAVASIIIERMVGFLSALFLGLISLLLLSYSAGLDARFNIVWWSAGAILFATIVFFAASFSKSLFNYFYDRLLYRFRDNGILKRVRVFHSIYLAYQDQKGNLAVFSGLTFCEQLMPILHSWLIALGLGVEVGLLYIAGAVPLALLISRIPISIDGLGVFDGAFILLMAMAGVSASEAVAIAMVGRILQTASWLPWWFAHVVGAGSLRPPRSLVESS